MTVIFNHQIQEKFRVHR